MALSFVFRRCEGQKHRAEINGVGQPEPGSLAWGYMEPWHCRRRGNDCLCFMVLFRDMVLLVHVWTSWPVWTGMIPGNCRTIAWELGSLRRLIKSCDVDCLCAKMNQQFKGVQGDVIVEMTDRVESNRLQRCVGGCRSSLVHCPVGRIPFRVIGRFGCGRVSVGCSDWLHGCAVPFISARGVRIGYIKSAISVRCSTDAAPVTGSLVFFDTFDCLHGYCAAECASSWLFCGTDCDCLNCYDLFIGQVDLCLIKTMEGVALVEDRACITFGVELCVPWDAPEAVVDINSEGVVPLGSVPDVVGLFGRRPDAAESWILQGRDARSIRVLVPDSRGLDQNFHNVTIVDMGVAPESAVSLPELSLLREQWPPAIFRHMGWLKQDLEVMRADAKKRFRQARLSPFRYCGTLIRCDMYRQVSFGPGAVMAVPSVLVYGVEGHSTGLYGSC